MRRHINSKRIRSNALERYLNESSFCYENIGFVSKEAKRPSPISSSRQLSKYQSQIEKESEKGVLEIKNPCLTSSLHKQKSSVPHSAVNLDSVSQNTDIRKNKPFLRGYKKLLHCDKVTISVFMFHQFA